MLSIKGREPFIRMQLWLTDPKNVEKLQSIKNQRRGANKRKRNHTDVEIPWSTYENHTYNYAFPPPSPYLSAKKSRFLFSEEQKEALRLVFSMDPYPSTATIEFLANELNLSVRTITNWFHNHRMRLKQQPFANSDDYLSNEIGTGKIPSAHTSGMKDGTKFDPVQFRLILNHRLAELTQEKNSNKTQKIWSSTILNSSALSTHDDSCTLDLSISSQRFPHRGNNYYELNSTSETASAGNDDHSNSEQNDDSSYSFERGLSESSDRESTDDQPLSFSTYDPHQKQTNLQKKATDPSSSSKRRKPAMPQWVDPGLELSPDSDLYSESEDNDIEPESKKNKEIINGVCVLQTGNFDLCMPKENTVRIEPAPAPDEHEVNPRSKKETTTKNNTVDSMNIQVSVRSDNKEIREDIKIDRKYNIERLERCLKDQEEGWDIDEETEKECNNNETCDGKHKHKTLGQMGVLMK
ncbi:homeobox protein cut-like [Limulus polyphemus]|uniref:Homeobox protein cut-like n=1 Tax=Limulus polyphemus TaxID=6850 RepID=A0ABM1BTJ3_LIMPO|nr:homeobox protein cut-like [Limulus polyphemus]